MMAHLEIAPNPENARNNNTSEMTSDSSTACDVDRRKLRNWRNVAKQLDTVLNTWVRMDTSESDSPAVGLPHLPKMS